MLASHVWPMASNIDLCSYRECYEDYETMHINYLA